MSNYVDDDLDLPNVPKVDSTGGATGQWDASDAEAHRSFLLDLKNAHLGTTVTNATGAIIAPGAPCYVSSSGVLKSKANAASTAECDGLAAAQFAIGGTGKLRARGDMPLTTAQWDAVTGQTGGLTPDTVYYVDTATAGKLTTTAPSANPNLITRVGRALSSTVMRLGVQPPIGL